MQAQESENSTLAIFCGRFALGTEESGTTYFDKDDEPGLRECSTLYSDEHGANAEEEIGGLHDE